MSIEENREESSQQEQSESREQPRFSTQIIMPDSSVETITAETKMELIEKLKDLRETSNER